MDPHIEDVYQQLSAEHHEIRLLTLQPGQSEDSLSISLATVSLDSNPAFEALSYVWGDISVRSPITISNNDASITSNLGYALRRTRLSTSPRTLWVDALCINQKDLSERSSQVKLMGRIYREASKVLVCLGSKDSKVSPAITLLDSWANDSHIAHSSCIIENGTHISCGNEFKTLDPLLSLPWWTRIWTFQEIILAQDATILCGSHSTSWKTILQAYEKRLKHQSTCCSYYRCNLCNQSANTFTRIVGGISFMCERLSNDGGMRLLDTVSRHCFRSASDARDRIYGFLGLIYAEEAEQIDMYYAWPVENVYTLFAVHDMLFWEDLHVLSFAADNGEESSLDQLPSWVPDLTCRVKGWEASLTRRNRTRLFGAAKGLEGRLNLVNQQIISITGGIIDNIEAVGDLLDERGDVLELLQQWMAVAKLDVARLSRNRVQQLHLDLETKSESSIILLARAVAYGSAAKIHNPYITGGTLEEAFQRTMTLDSINDPGSRQHRRATQEDVDACKEWLDLMLDAAFVTPPGVSHTPAFVRVDGSILGAITNRRFFTTNMGYIGIGPPGLRVGDSLVVLYSGTVPLVLRKNLECGLDLGDGAKAPLWTVVGDCYVHGIMDGEAVGEMEGRTMEMFIS